MENKKNLKSLRNDKRAVSPVIGVILMVAITVILAAVIGAFVFGFGAPEMTPLISFKVISASATNDYVVLEHTGGDSVLATDLRGTIDGDGDSGAGVVEESSLTLKNAGGVATMLDAGDRLWCYEGAGNPMVDTQHVRVTIIDKTSGQQIYSIEVPATT